MVTGFLNDGDGGIRTICLLQKPSKYQHFRGSQLSIVSICQHKKVTAWNCDFCV